MKSNVFECKMCGKCCEGIGGIYLTEEDIVKICLYLAITRDVLISNYCETINRKIRLKVNEQNSCIFYDKESKCTIHLVKPEICVKWPFFEANLMDEHSFHIAKIYCPGIDKDCTHEEFVRAWKTSKYE